MTQEHKEDIHKQYRDTNGKISLLSEYVGDRGDVADPWQRGPERYRECAASIKSNIDKLGKKL